MDACGSPDKQYPGGTVSCKDPHTKGEIDWETARVRQPRSSCIPPWSTQGLPRLHF